MAMTQAFLKEKCKTWLRAEHKSFYPLPCFYTKSELRGNTSSRVTKTAVSGTSGSAIYGDILACRQGK